ncbi:hypothetical protein FAGAP_893 [Fusarium agapanthi]|uniref:Uncharacterized protein n=1 Tax=Fusarium agapanthi TaxID=1803897 RepID=A0A9P5BQ69_9HYPO|nr:hypothetical protein FAGAP_893 [Fusarium agapanthi]
MAPEKPRSRSPHPEDRGWVSSAMRKRGMTAIKKNYRFGKDCDTFAFLLFYNKIHQFWDGSIHIPQGETLPEDLNAVAQDIWRRQCVSNGELVLRPARQRKQGANTKPCRVTKSAPRPSPRTLSLRSRGRQGGGFLEPGASPTEPQITVASGGDESELEVDAEDDGESVWGVPESPAPRAPRRRGRDSARRGETATRFRREARLDGDGDHPARDRGRIDVHVGDDGMDSAHGEGDDRHYVYGGDRRRSWVRGRSRPAEPNDSASNHLGERTPGSQQEAVMPCRSVEEQDAEGEPWCEPVAPFASMAVNGPSEDTIQLGHSDDPGSAGLTAMMTNDDWMQSAMMDFGEGTGYPGAHQWGDMLEFDLDNLGMDMNVDLDLEEMMDQPDNGGLPVDMIHVPSPDQHVTSQVPMEVLGGQVNDGLTNRDDSAIADANNGADNDAVAATQSTAATTSSSHMPFLPSMSGIDMHARTPSDRTHPSPRSTTAAGRPDGAEHTTTVVHDAPQPGHFTGNQLLAIITRALSQMDCREDTEPDMGNSTSWPIGNQGMLGVPLATPAY